MKSEVNELPLPKLLLELLKKKKWHHPDHKVIQKVIPFFEHEIVFLETPELMEQNSNFLLEELDLFFEKNSEKDARANALPWRDLKYSVLIAVNKSLGDDIAIALDYRTSITNPRVIANNWHTKINGCPWEEVSATFEEFVKQIGII